MVVAVPVVRVMQVTIDEIVDVIAVRHRLVTAARTVHVLGGVSGAGVARGARGRIPLVDRERMIVDVVAVGVMQVTVVQVVRMTVVLDGDVATVGAVGVVVIGVSLAIAHGNVSWIYRW